MNSDNFMLPGVKYDPANQLTWLEEQLAQIEADGGIAYIIAHYQPYNFTWQFGSRYHALIERYQHIIRFSMFGHTHDQYFSVSRSITNPEKIIGVSQIGASGTTYTDVNPSYALIDIDAETMLPVNFRIFAFDIDEANASDAEQPDWRLFTDYAKDYDLDGGVSTESLYNLAARLRTDVRFYENFLWDKSRRAEKKPAFHLFIPKE